MKSYTVRDIPKDQYKKLRVKAAEEETSINKTILKAIEQYISSGCNRRKEGE
jgi:plasmid stability protein